jgi:hypothetical protein
MHKMFTVQIFWELLQNVSYCTHLASDNTNDMRLVDMGIMSFHSYWQSAEAFFNLLLPYRIYSVIILSH